MLFISRQLIWLGVLLCCISGCLHREDQLNAKLNNQTTAVDDLRKQVETLSRELNRKQEIFTDLASRTKVERADVQVLVQDLRIELQGLRGDMEELRHENQKLNAEVQRLRAEVQKQDLDRVSGGKADDVGVYDRTLKIILEEKDYRRAIERFDDFIAKYPKSSLADNAAYWIGEGYYALGEFKRAVIEFQKVIDKYPKSDKACAALLKQAFSFEELNKLKKAKLFFEETVSRCKSKAEGKTARQQLSRKKSG